MPDPTDPIDPLEAELRRRDDDTAIAASQIVDHIAAFHLSHLEHAVDDFGRRRHERHFTVGPNGDRRTAVSD